MRRRPFACNDNIAGGDLAHLFRHASRLMARGFHRHGHAPHAQQHILEVIREQGPMPQKELMNQLGVRSASLSEVLAKLERRGLITRRRNENDKRGFIVAANDIQTPAAEAARHEGYDFFACLDENEQEQMTGLLRKIIEAVEQDYPQRHCVSGGRRRNRMFGRRKEKT